MTKSYRTLTIKSVSCTFRASTGEVAAGYAYSYDEDHSAENRSRGQLTNVKLLNGSGGTPLWQKSLTYNSLGLLAAETVTYAATPQAYTTQYGYDSYHRPVTTRYPDGETLTLSYNSRGLPLTLTTSTGNATLVDAARYDPSGRLTSMAFPAGGLHRTQTYHTWKGGSNNSNGRLASILVGTAADDDNRLKLTYGYDSFGNIRTLKEGYNNGSLTQNDFTYDAQNRLTNAFGQNYRYDDAGRMTHYEGASRTVNGSFPVHAVKGSNYAYDGNGNLVKRGSQTLSWDPGNRLAGVIGDGVNESYLYDDGGIRVQKTSDGVVTFYPFARYEVSDGVVTKYYRFGGQLIAMREGGTLTYLHNDHLGSVALSTSGSTVNQQYYAYGKKRGGGTLPTEHNFTGQKLDASGLMYYNARYYDPMVGTFVSPDTIIPEPANLLDYNRYMYVRGNPLKHIDPSGHCITNEDGSRAEDDAECWQLADIYYTLFQNSTGTPDEAWFAERWPITPDEWMDTFGGNSAFRAEELQFWLDSYWEHFSARTGTNRRVEWHGAPPLQTSLNIKGLSAGDITACMESLLGCGNLLGDISIASGGIALGCALTGNGGCTFVAGTVSSVSGTASTAITVFNAVNNIANGEGTARDYADITVGVVTTAAPGFLTHNSTNEVYDRAVDLTASSVSRFAVPQKQKE